VSNTSTAEFNLASGFKVLSTQRCLDFGCDFTNKAPPPLPEALISLTTVHCPFPGFVLIKDNLIPHNWKMEQETKMIGENLCFKATTVIERPVRTNNFRFGRRNTNEEEKEQENEIKTEQVIVTAWYTLNIPVNHGPGNYWGLPGLILEINDGNTQILCTKIVLNPKEKAEITAPKKGKEVTQKEFDKIQKQKTKEMRERFRNERQKSGSGRHFRIGG